MKFLQYAGENAWYEIFDHNGLVAENINGGWHVVDENDPRYMQGIVLEAEGWCDLLRKTGWNPWALDEPSCDMWIAPDGTMYHVDGMGAHEITAQDILEKLYGEDVEIFCAGDRLFEKGWTKVSTGLMCRYYDECGYYDNVTDEQWIVIQKWKEKYCIK